MDSTGDFLTCPICLEFARNAIECHHCNTIMCQECCDTLKKRECPNCRQVNFATKPSILARRMVGAMSADCPNKCGEKTTVSELEVHLKKCPERSLVCKQEDCKFEGRKKDFLAHVFETHADIIVKQFDSQIEAITADSAQLAQPGQLMAQNAGIRLNDPTISRVNAKNRKARLGASGKYFCGGPLETPCMCCNGFCGTDDGCNCAACMQLDIESKNLPPGFLVNREGFPCRKGTSGSFYCGRKCMYGVAFCDGYCGPTDGPACPSCRTINEQHQTRYKGL